MIPQRKNNKKQKVAIDDLREAWPMLLPDERFLGFRVLPRAEVEDFFLSLRANDQMDLLLRLPEVERRFWMRFLPSHAAADVIQEAPEIEKEKLLQLLDDTTRSEVSSLLAYAEDDAGGLMSPDFIRLRPDMGIDQAITYVKKQTQDRVRSVLYLYVLDPEQRLLGVLPFRDLLTASPDKRVHEIMRVNVATVNETTDQEEVALLLKQRNFLAVPVVNDQGIMKGIVTADTMLRIAEEEATEDIQKMGGTEVLSAPYFETGFVEMIRKRGGWLAVLFLGEMLTASAMGFFEDELKKATVLMLFVPLIISSGGNSGSQASTLVIRAMSLGEVSLRDWFHVVKRELVSGLALGSLLGVIGFFRILTWQWLFHSYGDYPVAIALAVGTALVGVVMFGTLAGSMLPFILRRCGLDPASASAPFVATLVDVSGLVIYFTAALLFLHGTLL